MIHRKQGEYQKAIENFSFEIKYKSQNEIKAYINRAFCFAKLGDHNNAISDYNSVLRLDNKNIHAYHNRAISYEKLGKYNEAINDINEVIKLKPDDEHAKQYLDECMKSIH